MCEQSENQIQDEKRPRELQACRAQQEERTPENQREDDTADSNVLAGWNDSEIVVYRREQQGPDDDAREDEHRESEIQLAGHADELRDSGGDAERESGFRLGNGEDEQH